MKRTWIVEYDYSFQSPIARLIVDGREVIQAQTSPNNIEGQPGDTIEFHVPEYAVLYVPYGSAFYGESQDEDYVAIKGDMLKSHVGWETAEKFLKSLEADLGNLRHPQADVVGVNWDNPMYVLALGCAAKEYPCLKPIHLDRLLPAARENSQKRMALFKHFPSPFTARKAAFAHYQFEVLDVLGEFLDTKSKVLEFVPGAIREDVKDIFYHNEDAETEAMFRVYEYFFGDYPRGLRTETVRYAYANGCPLVEIVRSSGDVRVKVHNPDLYKIYPHEIIGALNACVPPD